MSKCDACGKEISIWNSITPRIGKAKGKKFCSFKCWRNFGNEKVIYKPMTKKELKKKRLQIKAEIRQLEHRIKLGWIGIIACALTLVFLAFAVIGILIILSEYKKRDRLRDELDRIEDKLM